MTRYEKGFLTKCAEHGVDRDTAVQLLGSVAGGLTKKAQARIPYERFREGLENTYDWMRPFSKGMHKLYNKFSNQDAYEVDSDAAAEAITDPYAPKRGFTGRDVYGQIVRYQDSTEELSKARTENPNVFEGMSPEEYAARRLFAENNAELTGTLAPEFYRTGGYTRGDMQKPDDMESAKHPESYWNGVDPSTAHRENIEGIPSEFDYAPSLKEYDRFPSDSHLSGVEILRDPKILGENGFSPAATNLFTSVHPQGVQVPWGHLDELVGRNTGAGGRVNRRLPDGFVSEAPLGRVDPKHLADSMVQTIPPPANVKNW